MAGPPCSEPWGREPVLIAATGWGQESDVRESQAAGFDAHLTKPPDIQQAEAVIEALVARRRKGESMRD